MAIQTLGHVESFNAGADLSSSKYKAVQMNTSGNIVDVSAITNIVIGILQNAPVTDEPAAIALDRRSKIILGATLTPGVLVGTNASGKATADASTNYTLGILVEGGNTDDVGSVILHSKTAKA